MNTVIERLVEIEQQAQRIASEAKGEEECLQARVDEASECMRLKFEELTAVEVEKIRNSEMSFAALRVQQINSETGKQLALMDEEYSKNHSMWVDDLFNIIIGW